MAKIAKQDLLIIDDFGLQILDDIDRLILLEIMEDRYGLKSTIISSQLPVKVWYDIIGESTIADAIMDRLVNGAFRIEIKSKKSLRE
jgi:DNA replication protein DnaC